MKKGLSLSLRKSIGKTGQPYAKKKKDIVYMGLPGSGRSPGEGNGNPLQYPCLEDPVDREAW